MVIATRSIYNPHTKKLQGMTNNVGLTFSVGDVIPWFRISIEQRQLELVTLNTICTVVSH